MKKSYVLILLLVAMILTISAVGAADSDVTSDLAISPGESDSIAVALDDDIVCDANTEILADDGGNNLTKLEKSNDDFSNTYSEFLDNSAASGGEIDLYADEDVLSKASADEIVLGEGSDIVIDPITSVYYDNPVTVTYTAEDINTIEVIITDSDANEVSASVDTATDGQVTITGLAGGVYSITIINKDGDEELGRGSADFEVLKYDVTFSRVSCPTARPDTNPVITLTLSATDATGNISVSVDGNEYTGEVNNGVGVITLPCLSERASVPYDLVYSGDAKYNSKTGTVKVNVNKYKIRYTVNVQYDYAEDVGTTFEYGKVIIPVTNIRNNGGAPTVRPSGNMTLILDGQSYYGEIVGQTANIYIPDLPAWEYYEATVIYEGDYYYKSSADSGADVDISFWVEPTDVPETEFIVDSVGYSHNPVIRFDNPCDQGFIYVRVDNGRTIYIEDIPAGENNITVVLPNVLAVGTHIMEIDLYAGMRDWNYNGDPYSAEVTFEVIPCTPIINVTCEDVTYPDDVVITVQADLDGDYVLNFDGKTRYLALEAGVPEDVIFSGVDAKEEEYQIIVYYSAEDNGDDENYTDAINDTVSVKVFKASSNVTIDQIASVTYPDDVVITYTVVNKTTVTIVVKDSEDNEITDGVDTSVDGQVSISGLDAGDYTIAISNAEEGNYNASSADASFTVDIADSSVVIDPIDSVVYPADVVINYTVVNRTTVTVVVRDGEDNEVTDGVDVSVDGQVSISGLDAGDYTITITNAKEGNYNESSATAEFTVEMAVPELEVDISNATYPENVTITVTSDVDGIAYVNVYNDDYDEDFEVPVVNGTGSIDIPGLDAGDYYTLINYIAGDNYEDVEAFPDFTVERASLDMEVNISETTYPNNVTITVTSDVDGVASVKVFNEEDYDEDFEINVVDGTGSISIPGLNAGKYAAIIIYDAGNNYEEADAYPNFNVTPADSSVTIEPINTVTYPNDVVVAYAVVNKTTVSVAVKDGEGNEITDGVDVSVDGQVSISGLDAGNYSITITNAKEGNYDESSATAEFTVDIADSSVTIEPINNVTYPNDVVVAYAVVNKTTVSVVVKDGEGNEITDGVVVKDGEVSISGLDAGDYTITIINAKEGNYNESSATAEFTVDIADSSVVIDPVDSVVYPADVVVTYAVVNKTTVSVVVKDSEGNEITDGVDASVAGQVTLSGLDAGDYTIIITNAKEGNYDESSATAEFTVDITDSSVIIDPIANVVYPADAVVTYTVVNQTTVTVIVKDSEGNEITDGVDTSAAGKVTISGLDAGDYTISVSNAKEGNYNASSATAEFTVDIADSGVVINPIDAVVYPADAVITYTVVNETTVTIVVKDDKGNEITDGVDTSISGQVTISGLDAGDYTITITNAKEGNYNESTAMAEFSIIKTNSTLNIDPITDVTYPEDVKVNYTLDFGVISEVIIEKDGNIVPASVVVDESEIVISGLGAGNYTITITSSGDDNHNASSISDDFTVNKFTPTIEVSSSDVTYPGNVVVTITSDIAGYCVVTIGDDSQDVVLKSGVAKNVTFRGLSANEEGYVINVTYESTDNYESACNDSEIVKVFKADSKVSIYPISNVIYPADLNIVYSVENRTDVEVKVINDETGEETIVPAENITMSMILLSGFDAGNYTLIVNNTGNDNYNSSYASAEFSIDIAGSEVVIDPIANVVYPNDVVVTYTIVNETTLDVVVRDGEGNDVDADINTEIAGQITISGLDAGEYSITITNAKEGNYDESSATAEFAVNITDSSVTIDPIDAVTYPNDVVVAYTVVNETSVTVVVEDSHGNEITDGVDASVAGQVIISGLKAGEYTITITNAKEGNYNESSASAEFSVIKNGISLEADANDTMVDVNANVKVILSESDAAGTVTITVDGVDYTAEVDGGSAVVALPLLPAGEYAFDVTYSGDDKYESNTTSVSFAVDKYVIDFAKAKGHPGRVDKNATVDVILSESDATGTVSIIVDGVEYSAELVNGAAVIYAPLLPAGTYNFDVIYSGDDKYENNTAPITFNVNKYYPTMKATAESVRVDENATVNVALPSDATGTATITVDGADYTAEVIDGKAAVKLPVISEAGSYAFDVAYSGDDKYRPYTTNVTFNVLKNNLHVKATARSVKIGDDVVVNIALSKSDAKGAVSIEYGDTVYAAAVEDGAASIVIPDLPIGQYSLTVEYSGDDAYNAKNTTVTFDVDKKDADLKATARTVHVGEDVVVNVALPEDATGDVTISVDGTDYSASVEDGAAVITIPDLALGQYALEVQYSGDDNYEAENTTVTFNVNKFNPSLKASARTVHLDEDVVVNVALPDDATGDVTISVDGTDYSASVEDGVAVITLPDMPLGQYALEVQYSGDDKYLAKNTTVTFNVNKKSTTMKATARTVKVGENVVVNVVLAEDVTGDVVIEVNNVKYTVAVENGVASIVIPNLAAGQYALDVKYSGDDRYKAQSTKVTFNVNKHNVRMKVKASYNSEDDFAVISTILSDDATGSISVEINGKNYTSNIVEGSALIAVSKLSPGDYTLDVKYSGDDKYKEYTSTASLKVEA